MIRSMTAFGRAATTTPTGRWVVEVHSVNRKMLDLSIYLPKNLLFLDVELRKWLAPLVHRGQVTIRVVLQLDEAMGTLSDAHLKKLSRLKAEWEKIAEGLGFDPKEAINFAFLARQLETHPTQDFLHDEERIAKELREVFATAVKEWNAMKEREGNALLQDLLLRLEMLERALQKIEAKAPDAPLRYRQKLTEKIAEISSLSGDIEDRVLREVALYAEKLDVTEELVRLKSHLEQFRKALSSEEKSIGRTLDFLTQEIHREIMTISSKSADGEVISLTLAMKGELEKIKEQVQNIE